MTKRFFFLIGAIFGFVLSEILRRKPIERLTELDAKAARSKAQHEEFDKAWQEDIAKMPFDERIDYELWEAGMRLFNWNPPEEWLDDWENGDDDDEYE